MALREGQWIGGALALAVFVVAPFMLAVAGGLPHGADCYESSPDNGAFIERIHTAHLVSAGLVIALLAWIAAMRRRRGWMPLALPAAAAVYLVLGAIDIGLLMPLALIGFLNAVGLGLGFLLAGIVVAVFYGRAAPEDRPDYALVGAGWVVLVLGLPTSDVLIALYAGGPLAC